MVADGSDSRDAHDPHDHTDVASDQSEPSKRRDEHERAEPHQEAEDTVADAERSTAPQSPYSGRAVGIGIAVFLVGLAVTFGVPLLFG